MQEPNIFLIIFFLNIPQIYIQEPNIPHNHLLILTILQVYLLIIGLLHNSIVSICFIEAADTQKKQDKMNYGCYASLPWTRPNRANPTGNWFLEPLVVWGQMVGPGWTWYHVEEYVALVCEFLERKRYRFITCISTLNCLLQQLYYKSIDFYPFTAKDKFD